LEGVVVSTIQYWPNGTFVIKQLPSLPVVHVKVVIVSSEPRVLPVGVLSLYSELT
jgi:hypothetical protein